MHRIVILLALPAFLAGQNQPQTQAPGFAPRDQRYRIQPNDVVEIQFRFTPEYNVTATVQPDGYMTTQIAGDIKIAGLTLAEASGATAKQASSRLKDPEVTILLRDFVKPHFVVAGEVSHPGTFDLRGDVGIIQAIAMSGGFKEGAKRSQVVLLRRMNQEFVEVKTFDVKKLMTASKIREDITLRPDDMLVVPQNKISIVEPYVRVASLALYGLSFGIR